MKTIFCIALLLICSISTFAQANDFVWVGQIGGEYREPGVSIITDVSGNIYSIGGFDRTTDFDPGPDTANLTAIGGYDMFIQKMNTQGNLVWVKQIGGSGNVFGVSIATDASRNVYIIGNFLNTVDFDPNSDTTNLSSDGSQDIFIQKLDADGNLLWVKQMGGIGNGYGEALAIDSDGNIYAIGYFYQTIDFDPGIGITNLTSIGQADIFVQKLDPNGNLLWVKQIGGIGTDWGRSITTDADDHVLMTGMFSRTVDFDPDIGVMERTSNGGLDIFIQKLDSDGNFLWAKQMGGIDLDFSPTIAIDTNNNVYTTGSFQDTVDFDPGPGIMNFTAIGESDMFIQKLDANGDWVWTKHMEGRGISNAEGRSISIDKKDNIFIVGSFRRTIDFDPNAGETILNSIIGSRDIFIQKLDVSGNLRWVKQIGGSFSESLGDITTDNNGNIYTIGGFQFSLGFDTGTVTLTSQGDFDTFILKLGPCLQSTYATEVITACDSFTWIDGHTYTASTNTPTTILPNAVGCDSVVTLDLTILCSSTGTDVVTACDSLIWIDGITYLTSSDTAIYTLTNAVGCDSTVTLNLTIQSVDTSTTLLDQTITANYESEMYQWIDCETNMDIVGETSQSFSPEISGTYAVLITDNGCSYMSSCKAIEILIYEELLIYPNPSKDGMFTILYDKVIKQIAVYDLRGRLVFDELFQAPNLDLRELSPDVYYIQVKLEDGEIITREIVIL